MAPTVLVWLCLLHCCLPFAHTCLQCDPLVQELNNNVLKAFSNASVDTDEIMRYVNYLFAKTSRYSYGVIDATTLSKASEEYRAEISMLLRDVSLHVEQEGRNVISDMLDKGNRILQEHLETFVHTGLCPNSCGLLNQRVINCETCASQIRTCLSPLGRDTCGKRHLEAEEGSSAVLDCSLPWHNLVEGDKLYQFSRYSNPAATFIVFTASASSSVVLKHINLHDKGLYQCHLLDSNNKVLTSLKYQLTVKPSTPTTPAHTPPTIPPHDSGSLPDEPPKELLAAFVGAVIVLGLAGCCGLAVAFGLALRRGQLDETVMAEEGRLPD
ncbi:izumo sperm-egg fusion protein 1-like [Brienomyrus brachyistius]|uniref:izumo sperm-egg fusion protein 1-like n=1 Tax=Brienomyrus brachyistius TaxID=42636 RepID=UPI0020B37E05|nr:izumo sperm-egg fusion protein 1-like [Brienomyrus brachyistius]